MSGESCYPKISEVDSGKYRPVTLIDINHWQISKMGYLTNGLLNC